MNALVSGGALTSSVLGSMISAVSFPVAAWLTVVPGVVALFASLKLVEPAQHEPRSGNVYGHLKDALRHVRRNRTLRLASLAGILEEGFGATAFQFQAALYAQVWPLWAIGLARALGELIAGVGFRYSDAVIRRAGERHIILASSVYSWLACIVGALFPSVWSPLIISSSVLFYGPATTAQEALKQREFTQAQRATLASLNSFAASILHGVIALGIGVVADQLGAARSLLVIELGFTSAIILTWQLWRVLRHRQAPAR